MTKRSHALFVLLLVTACSDDPLTVVQPRIEVEPEAIDFGEGIVNGDNLFPLIVRNKGEAELLISGAEVRGGGAVFSVREFPERVSPIVGEEMLIAVFVPTASREAYEATLVISSNDPKRPELEVPLNGVGGVREIDVTPLEIDFGTVNEGTRPRRQILVQNVGKDVLNITGVTFTSTSVDLTLVDGTFAGGPIAALSSTVVEVEYSPVDLGGDEATVTINSDDEDEPTIVVSIVGRANLAPRAIAWACARNAAMPGCVNVEVFRDLSAGIRTSVNLDGRESFDPEGGRIDSYRWELIEKPDGAAGIFQSSNDLRDRRGATGDLQVDRVGRYEYRLVVKDDRGLDSLDAPEAHIVLRPKDLDVRLTWDVGTDVDAHLVRPGGTVGDYGSGLVGTSTGTDCSSFNRAPNWNDTMTSLDDPSLDRDVVSGEGPEVISLDSPEETGPYAAYAHYCDSRNVGVNVHATMEVYVKGELVATIPDQGGQRMVPGDLWHAGDITWSETDQTVTVVPGTAMVESRPGLCRND